MVLSARPIGRSLALVVFGLVAFGIASFAWRSASAATVSVEGGNDYFCSSAFDGGVCETNVTAGDTVTWTMAGGVHTVTLCGQDFSVCPAPGGWDSGILTQGDTYSQTFASPGTYAYRCELHPTDMRGKIVAAAVVTPSPSPTPIVTAEATNAPPAASATSTPVALPRTGGVQDGGGDSTLYASLGLALLAGAVLAFTLGRRRAS